MSYVPRIKAINYRILYFFSGRPFGNKSMKRGALDQRIAKFVGGGPKRQAIFDEEIVNLEAAQLVFDLRTKAGLTQRQLAKKVGTTASVICRMEQADYEGSLAMLRRIVEALNRRLELHAVPIRAKQSRSSSVR